ncbi:Kelch-like protein 1 [Gossypium arboreum]|uniref:Kelch-like protein 1 n=1 Tax=Gossypium arboreum TaxID=29729 RepID=A0A0B0MUQ8_GOSAR|nr:Kelch-like protein 1 [Gossypium arboreum]
MSCPRHGLILALVSRPMYVPNMSYTSTRPNADAMSQTWSYTGSHKVADACPKHVLH